MSSKPKVDRDAYPHVYSGPSTKWGLVHGAPCRKIGRRAGGVRIVVESGRRFVVGERQVERAG